MEKCYCFAGVEISVSVPEQIAYEQERLLENFAVARVSEKAHRFSFSRVERLPQPRGACLTEGNALRVYSDGTEATRYLGTVGQTWENGYACIRSCGREHSVIVKLQPGQRLSAKTVLNCLMAEHLVAGNAGVFLHSSYIVYRGKAILFTAPSGTGKSTQAALWERLRGAETVNGDRSAIRLQDQKAVACGVPFAGSSDICKNQTHPLAAIVYLKQAPKTAIRRLRGAEAFRRIWEGCSVNTWEKTDVEAVSQTVAEVLQRVPVFELACTPDETAILALEGVIAV